MFIFFFYFSDVRSTEYQLFNMIKVLKSGSYFNNVNIYSTFHL